jgi:predicted transcriptional regulator of viral defense system
MQLTTKIHELPMPSTTETVAERLLGLARQQGVLRICDLAAHGIHPETMRRLHQRGLLIRIARGLYAPADAKPSENRSFAEVCKRVPHAVICLLSALRFHNLTTQMPFEVWLAIDRRARRPKDMHLPLRVFRFSGAALTSGIEDHLVEGVPIKVYNPAKTVADCFKFRNKIGIDVALEALRDCRKQRRATADELWQAARICRVHNVMRPYLEATS